MFTPSIFGENLFDDWMDDFEKEFDKELRPAKKPLYRAVKEQYCKGSKLR